jgi:hypothetical protein
MKPRCSRKSRDAAPSSDRGQPRAVLEPPGLAAQVQARDEAPDLPQQAHVVEFRNPPADPRADRETELAVAVQARPAMAQRRDDRDVAGRQLEGEAMLLQDRRVAPAPRPVELDHDGPVVLEADLVDAVLVAVQGQQPAVAAQPEALHRVEDVVRLQVLVGERLVLAHAHGLGVGPRL